MKESPRSFKERKTFCWSGKLPPVKRPSKASGRRRIPPEIAAELAEHVADDALTIGEVGIPSSVGVGTSNKIIASQLSVSEATVKAHMKSILSKLGANDRTHAVTIFMNRGFLEG